MGSKAFKREDHRVAEPIAMWYSGLLLLHVLKS